MMLSRLQAIVVVLVVLLAVEAGAQAECPSGSSTLVCRPATGECDVAEVCDGVNSTCPADVKRPAGTACTDDANKCTRDECNGVDSACHHTPAVCPPGMFCDSTTGQCRSVVKNVAALPFGGLLTLPSEDADVAGTVIVKTLHFPGSRGKPIATAYKIDKLSVATGRTSGRTYQTTGRTTSKFKYTFPTETSPTYLASKVAWCICCSPLTEPKCTETCCYPLHVALSFDGDGRIMDGESGASAMRPPARGSCTAVVEVCN